MPWLVRLIPTMLVTNFSFSAAFTMLAYWSRHNLHDNTLIFGLVEASWASGMIVGSRTVSWFFGWKLNVVVGAMGLGLGIGALGFAASSWAPLSMGILVLTGATNGVVNAALFTVMQRTIPEAVRGRSFGFLISLITMASPVRDTHLRLGPSHPSPMVVLVTGDRSGGAISLLG